MPFFCERRMFIQFKLQKLQFWLLNDQITVSFVRAVGAPAEGRMFDMSALKHINTRVYRASAFLKCSSHPHTIHRQILGTMKLAYQVHQFHMIHNP
jgi:hypothetical protein